MRVVPPSESLELVDIDKSDIVMCNLNQAGAYQNFAPSKKNVTANSRKATAKKCMVRLNGGENTAWRMANTLSFRLASATSEASYSSHTRLLA